MRKKQTQTLPEHFTVTRTSTFGYYGVDDKGEIWGTFHCDPKWSRKCAVCGNQTNSGYVNGDHKRYVCASHVNFVIPKETQ